KCLHPPGREVDIVSVRHREDHVRLVLQRQGCSPRGGLTPCLVPPQRRQDREIRNVLHPDNDLALSRGELDEGILLRQSGAAEPPEDRDAAGRRVQDPSRRRSLERGGEGALREVEDERARSNQIVPYGPAV